MTVFSIERDPLLYRLTKDGFKALSLRDVDAMRVAEHEGTLVRKHVKDWNRAKEIARGLAA